MNFLLKTSVALGIVLSLASCDDINERVIPRCTGKSGDLLIVADSAYYNNLTGTAIQQIFSTEQVGLPQREPLFHLIHVPHKSFARIFHPTRNIIMVNIEPGSKPKLSVREEVWSESQLVVSITAPNDKVAAEAIEKNGKVLLDYFNNREIDRLKAKYSVNSKSSHALYLNEKFGLSLNLDELYIIAEETEDFIWLRKDKSAGGHPISQGIMIYTYPYVSDSTFELSELVAKRNAITKEFVAGGKKGSYMTNYEGYTPVQREVSLNGVYVNELRGLWDMKGDFMGGPYINYSLVDEQNNRVVCIDGYVYAPKFDKREFLREQEALIKSITF